MYCGKSADTPAIAPGSSGGFRLRVAFGSIRTIFRRRNSFLLATGAVMSVNACSNADLICLTPYEFLPRSFVGSWGSSMANRKGLPGSDQVLSFFAKKAPPPRQDTPTSSMLSLRPYSSKKSMSKAPRQPSAAASPPPSPAHEYAVSFESCSCRCAITMHSKA